MNPLEIDEFIFNQIKNLSHPQNDKFYEAKKEAEETMDESDFLNGEYDPNNEQDQRVKQKIEESEKMELNK